MKYLKPQVTFSEIPDEITLCIPITGCPNRCEGCHSPELREDIGRELTWENVNALIHINEGITCVCFMGGDQDARIINKMADHIKHSTNIKTAWYSGNDYISKHVNIANFDFIKIGHFDKDKGGLDNPSTNQVLYEVVANSNEFGEKQYELLNITNKFWK